MASIFKANENIADYQVGSWDVRSWGHYYVTAVEKKDAGQITRCEKDITVFPKQMLSLQVHRGMDMDGNDLGHKGRDEIWTVMAGTLSYIQNGEKKTAGQGDQITLRAGDIHCMINETNKAVKVHEVQTGVCQELDNLRLMDMGGRKVIDIDHPDLAKSRDLYKATIDKMPKNVFGIFNKVDNKVRVWTNRAIFLSKEVA